MDVLIAEATVLLQKRYRRPVHTVASVVETSDGKRHSGLNIDHFSGYVCAETSALASAFNTGKKHIVRVAAVRREADGAISVANMCGKCRQIFHDYAPGCIVAVNDSGVVVEKPIEELLPYSFMRQRQKIQTALAGDNTDIIG